MIRTDRTRAEIAALVDLPLRNLPGLVAMTSEEPARVAAE